MKVESLLLDLDGLILTGRHRYFSERLAKEHEIPPEEILPFFKREYGQCAIGQLDLKQVLPPWLRRWGWAGTVDDFLRYWFEGENQIDPGVIEAVDLLRTNGVWCAIATDNEKYRLAYILEELKVGAHFDEVYASCQIGHKKPSAEFFDAIFRPGYRVQKQTTMYWDDDPKNVAGGTEYGVLSAVYTDYPNFAQTMSQHGLLLPVHQK